ncbi:hypothetical protein HYV58_00920, partial [Candidatus Peregrinibacteria bacterium]|nr:hypothetical protein [Candidatus Peregrinibacteria bacterium]
LAFLGFAAFGIFGSFIFGPDAIPQETFVGNVPLGGLSLQEAKRVLNDAQKDRKVAFRLGGKAVKTSYKDLGISINTEKALAEITPKRSYGLAAVLAPQKEKRIETEVSIDKDQVKNLILSAFPALQDPEQTAAAFFVTSATQKKQHSFNFQKILRQLAYDSQRLQPSEIDLEVLPDDFEGEPEKTPEELQALKEELQGKQLVLRAEGDDIPKLEWKIPLKESGWLNEMPDGVSINESKLSRYFAANVVGRLERPVQDAAVKGAVDGEKSAKIEVEGVARDGIYIPIDENIERIQKSVSEGTFEVPLLVERTPSLVINETGVDLGKLELLATGRSNFAGSPEGRMFNIQKGLRENFNDILVPPGAAFSFNSFLGGPVTLQAGWKN